MKLDITQMVKSLYEIAELERNANSNFEKIEIAKELLKKLDYDLIEDDTFILKCFRENLEKAQDKIGYCKDFKSHLSKEQIKRWKEQLNEIYLSVA